MVGVEGFRSSCSFRGSNGFPGSDRLVGSGGDSVFRSPGFALRGVLAFLTLNLDPNPSRLYPKP